MSQKPKKTLTNRQALCLLYAVQQWMWVEQSAPKDGYSPTGYFKKFTPGHWHDYLSREIRDMALRQIRSNRCIACQANTSPNSTGDHIIPISKGGPQAAYNFMPLCKSCNSSKGNKDLFDWWYKAKARPLEELPKDIICMYARLTYQTISAIQLEEPAPEPLTNCLREYFKQTPLELREAILRSTGIKQ